MATKTVIDASQWNTVTDWSAVATQVDGIILRCGYRGYGTGAIAADSCFSSYIAGAAAAGIPLTVYFFSTAITEEEAEEEAEYAMNAVSGYTVSMPIFIDSEYSNTDHDGRSDSLSKATRTTIVMAFCAKVQAAGYQAGVYANDDWFNTNLNWSTIYNAGYKLWVAKYSTEAPVNVTSGCYVGWQYTSSNYLDGISTRIDTSYWYGDIGVYDTTHCYPAYTGTSESLVTALAAVGATDTSLEYRKVIALYSGIVSTLSAYTGTSTQNTTMLTRLKAGTLIDPATYDDSDPTFTVTIPTCKQLTITASDDIFVSSMTITKNNTTYNTSRSSDVTSVVATFTDVDSGDIFVASATDTDSRTTSLTYTANDSIEHQYVSKTTAATCTTDGSVVYTCSVCGDSYSTTISATGHNYDTGVFVWSEDYTSCVYRLTCSTCGNTSDTTCIVTASQVLSTTPQCGDELNITYTACAVVDGNTLTDVVTVDYNTLEHSYSTTVVAATCTTAGYTKYVCANCGNSYTANETSALGHDYQVTATSGSSCTEQGYTVYTCSRCGDTYTDYTAASGHTNEIYTQIDATCTEEGYITYRCSVCGAFTTVTLPMIDHSYIVSVQRDATCTEQGYTTYKCSVCGYTYTGDYVEALGHDYVGETVTTSCNQQGYTKYTCSRCGDTYNDDYESAAGHSFRVVEIIDPTCEDYGYDYCVCTVCGYTAEKNIVEALGHKYSITNTVEVTCTEDGYTEYTCSRCGYVVQSDVVKAQGHDYEEETYDPTCTIGGYTKYTCLTCGYTTIDDETDPLGHDYETLEYTAPTYKHSGYGKYECTRCGQIDEETYAMLTLTLGEKINITDCTLYPIPVSVDMDGHTIETGEYYIWNTTFVNDRVKITNSPDNSNTTGLVTGWIDIDEINKTITVNDSTKYASGDCISVSNIAVYETSKATSVVSVRSGQLWISSGIVTNGRIPVTNKYSYVENVDMYLGWINVSEIAAALT